MKKRLLPFLVMMAWVVASFGQNTPLVINPSNVITPQVMVMDSLITGCVEALNVAYDGHVNALGYFHNPAPYAGFPFQNGIVMVTDHCQSATTGYNPPSASYTTQHPNIAADLIALAQQAFPSVSSVYDVCILEFDFIPSSDTVTFRYIFASEEYPTYNCTQYNDVFAFFISGPGITGTFSNSAINVATIPGTTPPAPVSINNIHGPEKPGCPPSNAELYIHNGSGNATISFNGQTVPMTATAVLQACQTYHIVLALADVSDGALNSGVFIEAGSFTDGASVSITNVNTAGTFNNVYEGCENSYIFTRSDTTDLSQPVTFPLAYSGTATMGLDISNFPSSITIPAGQVSIQVPYTVYIDAINEPVESFIINIMGGCPCDPVPTTDTINIYNYTEFKAGITNTDSMYCGISPPASLTLHALCISHPAWFVTYQWSTGATTQDITIIPPAAGSNSVYWCQISDLCGNSLIDSITICVSPLSGLNVNKTNALCYGACNGTAQAVPTYTAPIYPIYHWSFPNAPATQNVSSLCAGVYRVTVSDASLCQFAKQFTITQPNAGLDPANSGIQPGNFNFCTTPGTINLQAFANIPNVTYHWNGSSNASQSFSVSPPVGINNYWVAITDGCGYTVYDTVAVKVSDMSNSFVDYDDATCFAVCNGSAHVYNPTGVPPFTYKWLTPNLGIVTTTNPVYANLCPGNYSLTVTDGVGCHFTTAIQIVQPEALSPQSGIVNSNLEFCGVAPPAVLTLETNANILEVNYLWSNGSTNSFLNISPQTGQTQYSVQISNLCGTTYYDTVTVKVSSFSGLNMVLDTTQCFNSCNGQVMANPMGGSAPFQYTWNPVIGSPTSGLATNLCQGEYSVTVKDNAGCQYLQTFLIGGPGPLSESVITEGDLGYCGIQPPPALDVHAAANTSGVSYLWSTGSTAFMTTVFPVSGANTYWCQFTDQCGNSYTDTILISISTLSGSTVNPLATQCYNSCDGQATAIPTNGMSPFHYTWSNGVSGNNPVVSNLCPGLHQVTVTDGAGCRNVVEFQVATPNPLTYTIIKQDYSGIYCTGFATVANPTGGTPPYSYLWSNGVTTYNNPNLCDGYYFVTVTDGHGCITTDTVRIYRLDGVGEIPTGEGVRIYPNPSLNGDFTIEFQGIPFQEATIEVYDATGKRLLMKTYYQDSAQPLAELENLPAGVLQVRINIDNKALITKQIVILR